MIALTAVVLGLSGSAAAAVVVVETQRSAPLNGVLPQLLGTRYVLRVAPDLTAGYAAWCIALIDIRTQESALAGPPNCVSSDGGPLVSRGGVASLNPSTGAVGAFLLFAIVNERVAALRAPDGARIVPISSKELPAGWRAAVTVETHPSTRPGGALVPVNSRGGALSTSVRRPVALATRPATRSDPARDACGIETRGLTSVKLRAPRVVIGSLPKALPLRPEFLSCYSATLNIDGVASTAALLFDSNEPGLASIPGSTALRNAPGVTVSPAVSAPSANFVESGRLFSRRVGRARLVVETSAPAAAAVRVLRDLVARY